MRSFFIKLSGSFVGSTLLAIICTNVYGQISCEQIYERGASYTYYIGDFKLVNPGKIMSKCVGVGYYISFSQNNGKESMVIGKLDDPSTDWPSSKFSFPDNPELLKNQNIPNWVSTGMSDNFGLIRKHRPNVASEWINYLSWKKSGSQGQDDPKAVGRFGQP
jgi:hypothetical protein